MKLYVKTEIHGNESYRSDEEYGDWYSDSDFDIEGVYANKPDGWNIESFDLPFEANIGEPVFVLWMTYSSGDSFGHSEGNGEVLWVFKDPLIALNAKHIWQKANDGDGHYNVEFIADGNLKVNMSNPASGYFENMSSLELKSFLINP
jgi:hypothetical protein